jgi:hypothetical protein
MSHPEDGDAQSTTLHEIKTLILSYHPVIALDTVEEERADAILDSVAAELDLPLFEWSVTRGLRRKGQGTAFHGTNQPLILLKHLAGLTVEGLFVLKDFAGYLEDGEVRRQFREVAQTFSKRKSTAVVTGDGVELPSGVGHMAAHYRLRLPSVSELRDLVREVIQSLRERRSFRIELGPDDLNDLLQALRGMTLKQARQILAYCIQEDGRLSREDIEHVIRRKGESIRDQGLLEFYPAASNRYEIGGFRRLREWLDRARVGFTAEARRLNLNPPKGIMLVGVQGCGKSLAAKYVARHWRMPLLKMDAGRLYDKYVGESEKNFRRATAQAEAMAPVVLWIDEIEKGFASAGGSGADGGLSVRVLGFLLTWMQEKAPGVFVVATANDVAALPPELLRKGRFDEIFFVDLPDAEGRKTIFRIHLALRKQSADDLDLDLLAAETDGFSGAEIEQAVITSLYQALHRRRKLTAETILDEVRSTVPLSVSRREEIGSLRRWAEERFVPAD